MEEYIKKESMVERLEKSICWCETELEHGDYRKGCIAALKDAVNAVRFTEGICVEIVKEPETKNDVLKRLFNGEWVDCEDVQEALGIDFKTGLKMFDFSRTAEWNPYPLNGQKITIKFRLKSTMVQNLLFSKQELEDLICGCSAQIQEFCVSKDEAEPFENLIRKLKRMVGDQN